MTTGNTTFPRNEVTEGTPNSPEGEVEKVIERLRDLASRLHPDLAGTATELWDMSRLLTTYAEDNERQTREIERLNAKANTWIEQAGKNAAAADAAQAEIERLRAERDEAQARAFRLADQIETYHEEAIKRRQWMDKAKQSRGYSPNISFDAVWDAVCFEASQAEEMRKALEEEIVDAYERGAHWWRLNGNYHQGDAAYLGRAASDYMDKRITARTALMKGGE